MKKYNKILIITILFISIFMNFILLFNKDMNIRKEVKVVKGMTESAQISDLNTQINELNKSHTEYANYIQTSKQAIATALTNEGVATSKNDTLETMANNISQILQARTKDATATADNISKGKTAYVNGNLITGTGADLIAASGKDYKITINYSTRFLHSYSSNGTAYNSWTSSSSYIIYLYKDGTYSTDGNKSSVMNPANRGSDIKYHGCSATIDNITIEAL